MEAKPIPICWNRALSIYASESFLRYAGDQYGWLGGFDQGVELRCILPYTIVEKAFIRMVRFRVETIPTQGELSLCQERKFLERGDGVLSLHWGGSCNTRINKHNFSNGSGRGDCCAVRELYR
jgi:hypothetical protein